MKNFIGIIGGILCLAGDVCIVLKTNEEVFLSLFISGCVFVSVYLLADKCIESENNNGYEKA